MYANSVDVLPEHLPCSVGLDRKSLTTLTCYCRCSEEGAPEAEQVSVTIKSFG